MEPAGPVKDRSIVKVEPFFEGASRNGIISAQKIFWGLLPKLVRLIGTYIAVEKAIETGHSPLITGALIGAGKDVRKYLYNGRLRLFLLKDGKSLQRFSILSAHDCPWLTKFLNINLRRLTLHGEISGKNLELIFSQFREISICKVVGGEVRAKQMAAINKLTNLQSLCFKTTNFPDPKQSFTLTRLQNLKVTKCQLRWAALSSLVGLQKLFIRKMPDKDGVELIRGLTGLTHLVIEKTILKDEDLQHLSSLSNLTRVDLSDNDLIDGPGLVHLAALPCLRALSFIVSSGFEGEILSSMISLTDLEIMNPKPIFNHLSALQNLTRLVYMEGEFAESDLNGLGRMTALQQLDLSDCFFTGPFALPVLVQLKSLCLKDLSFTGKASNAEESRLLIITALALPRLGELTLTLGCCEVSFRVELFNLAKKVQSLTLQFKTATFDRERHLFVANLPNLKSLEYYCCEGIELDYLSESRNPNVEICIRSMIHELNFDESDPKIEDEPSQ